MSLPPSLGNGRYVLHGVLGEGAQGTTYDATHTTDERAVAIKRFAVRDAKSWKDVELAEREARVLSTLDHPLVPRYIEHFEEDGALYLVMEKVQGETLDAIRRREGALSEEEVRRFLADADRALTYLHGRAAPIVHRDIKPRNVIRRPDGSYVLVDFGAVSELVLRRGGGSTIVGTMGYMAPEQFQGRSLPQTDVYAVGATALAALTGVEPETLPHRGLRVDVEASLGDRASPALVASLVQMVEPDPDLRARSLAAALDPPRSKAPSRPSASLVVVRTAEGSLDERLDQKLAQKKEDAAVQSIRNLLWVLWGLGWVIVPVTFGALFHMGRLIPAIMFIWLAAVFIVTWHKGAMIRAALRKAQGRDAIDDAHHPAQAVKQRVGSARDAAASSPQVRVDAPEVDARMVTAETEVDTLSEEPAPRARRAPR